MFFHKKNNKKNKLGFVVRLKHDDPGVLKDLTIKIQESNDLEEFSFVAASGIGEKEGKFFSVLRGAASYNGIALPRVAHFGSKDSLFCVFLGKNLIWKTDYKLCRWITTFTSLTDSQNGFGDYLEEDKKKQTFPCIDQSQLFDIQEKAEKIVRETMKGFVF